MAIGRGVLVYLLACISQVAAVPADSNTVLRFLVLGDFGGQGWDPYTSTIQKDVAHQMAIEANDDSVKAVLTVGDNIYENGVHSVDDERFKISFEDVYNQVSLQVPWYLIAGNHDHGGNVTAQILYTEKSKKWNFPDYNYTVSYTIPDSSSSITFVMIDTIILCGKTDTNYMGEPPLGPADVTRAEAQWQWIEHTLRHSRSEYLVVMGHYPVLSVGKHGPTKCLESRLLPLLHRYRVTATFFGHDHNLQHMKHTQDDWSVDHFIVGQGARVENHQLHHNSVPKDSFRFFWADPSQGGFAIVNLDAHSMNLSFVSSSGQYLWNATMHPRTLQDIATLDDLSQGDSADISGKSAKPTNELSTSPDHSSSRITTVALSRESVVPTKDSTTESLKEDSDLPSENTKSTLRSGTSESHSYQTSEQTLTPRKNLHKVPSTTVSTLQPKKHSSKYPIRVPQDWPIM